MTICLIKIEGSFNISLILLKILVLNNDNSEGGAEWYASQNPALDIDITCSRFDRLMRFPNFVLRTPLLQCNTSGSSLQIIMSLVQSTRLKASAQPSPSWLVP
jgi:hypothetical protein